MFVLHLRHSLMLCTCLPAKGASEEETRGSRQAQLLQAAPRPVVQSGGSMRGVWCGM